MASINIQSKDGGVDDGSESAIRLHGVVSPSVTIVRGDFDGMVPPVVSDAAPASTSSSVQERIVKPSSNLHSRKAVTETASSPDGSGTECLAEGSRNGGGGGSNAAKKPVWSKPSNSVVEVVSPVMGAVSWPALGESTKASHKSSSSVCLRALQVTRNASPSPLKLANVNNVNSTASANHVSPSAQRSMRRGAGSSGAYASSNGVVSLRPQANQDLKVETPQTTSRNPGTVAMVSYQRGHTYREAHKGGVGSQSSSGTDRHYQQNSYRGGNGGQHGYYGGHGNYDWNQNRSLNNRNANMQPHGGFSRPYPRPPVRPPVPTSGQWISPQMQMQTHMPMQMQMQMQRYGNNAIYPDAASIGTARPMIYFPDPPSSSESLGPPPFVAPMAAPMYNPFYDHELHSKIVKQIEYYFSNENLVKDTYLRQQMDKDGWVIVRLIANFKKVLGLTNNISVIIHAMHASTLVEVQGWKLRRRNEWKKWLMPANVPHSSVSSSSTASTPRSSNQDELASQLHGVALEEPRVEEFATGPYLSSPLQQGGIHTGPQARATVA